MLSWDFTSITEKYLCYQVKFLLRKLCKCSESVSGWGRWGPSAWAGRRLMRDWQCFGAAGAEPEPETRDWPVQWGDWGQRRQAGERGFTGLRNASQSASANGKPKMPNNIKQSRENSLKSIKTRYFLLCLFSMIWTANSMRAVSLVRTWKLEKPYS